MLFRSRPRVWNISEVSKDHRNKVTRLPNKTTPRVAVLGPENETAPFVAGTTVTVGLIDAAASETKLFNDERARGRVRGQ